jgi:hypothetical protein
MCAECGEHWLPTDPELWFAYYTDDEPPELVFYCPECAEAVRGVLGVRLAARPSS